MTLFFILLKFNQKNLSTAISDHFFIGFRFLSHSHYSHTFPFLAHHRHLASINVEQLLRLHHSTAWTPRSVSRVYASLRDHPGPYFLSRCSCTFVVQSSYRLPSGNWVRNLSRYFPKDIGICHISFLRDARSFWLMTSKSYSGTCSLGRCRISAMGWDYAFKDL